jgi:hypothetical protein
MGVPVKARLPHIDVGMAVDELDIRFRRGPSMPRKGSSSRSLRGGHVLPNSRCSTDDPRGWTLLGVRDGDSLDLYEKFRAKKPRNLNRRAGGWFACVYVLVSYLPKLRQVR